MALLTMRRARAAAPRKRLSRQTIHAALCLLLVALVFLPMLVSAGDYNLSRTNPLSIVSFLAVGVVAIANLCYASYRRPFSINVAHWTFMLMFFFIAPFVQYLMGYIPGQADPAYANGPANILEHYHLKANICILGWSFAYMVVYYRLTRNMGGPEEQPGKRDELVNVALLGGFALLIFAFLIAYYGVGGIFRTRGDHSEIQGAVEASDSAGVNLIIGTAIKSILVYLPILLLSIRRRTVAYYPVLVVALLLALSLNNPITVARFAFGTTAIGFICIFLARKRISALWIPLTLLFSFFTLFPLLNIARSSNLAEGAANFKLRTYTSQLTGGDFDAYAMYLDSMNYVDAGPGPRTGYGLASAVLYLVPRTAWPERSGGSGIDVAKYYKFPFTNLSCPLPGEGYLDFGVIGVLGYAALIAMYAGLMDRWYWRRAGGKLPPLAVAVIYPTLVGGMIILMRGSLHPILAYTSASIPAVCTLTAVARVGMRRRARPLTVPQA